MKTARALWNELTDKRKKDVTLTNREILEKLIELADMIRDLEEGHRKDASGDL